jgi:hypothetical protein
MGGIIEIAGSDLVVCSPGLFGHLDLLAGGASSRWERRCYLSMGSRDSGPSTVRVSRHSIRTWFLGARRVVPREQEKGSRGPTASC